MTLRTATISRAGRRTAAAGAALALAVLAACGGGPKKAGPGATAASPSTATSSAAGGVDPNAPEANAAGDIPDNQVFVAYTHPSGRFSVGVPEGWARSASDGTVTFTDKLNSIRLETVASASGPTVASVTSTDLPAIRATSSRFEAGTVKLVARKGGTAVLATYRADAPADPVTGKVVHDDIERYVFWRSGTAAVLTLSGPQGADNVDPWRIVTDSFRWQ